LATVTVLGTGGLVPDVVRMALQAGMKLRLVGADRASLTEALQKIAARQEALVAEGRLSAEAREADWARLTGTVVVESEAPADLVLLAPDAPRLAEMPRDVVGLGGRGALVLHPAPMAGGLAQLAIGPGVPLDRQALALAFGRKLGWKVLIQGSGAALDQRLRQVLSRAIAALEETGTDRAQIAATLASYGLGAGARPKLPPPPAGAAPVLAFCLAAVMNEAARIVSESAARRPSDVDAAAVLTGLFPRWEGGPLFQADRIGAMALRADLRKRAETQPQLFTPAPVFDLLLADGETFADLNRP
jgi:3-hydroxyacyl-CoA dehydrogenase